MRLGRHALCLAVALALAAGLGGCGVGPQPDPPSLDPGTVSLRSDGAIVQVSGEMAEGARAVVFNLDSMGLPLVEAPVTDLSTRRRRSPALLVAAAVAIIAAAVGGFLGLRGLGQDEEQAPPLAAPAQTVFNAPDASQVALRTANGGTLHVAVSATRQEMAVDARDLPPLDGQHVYQLWAVHDGLMSSAAVLGSDATGAAMAIPSKGTQIAVTVEPGNGSKQPTGEPIATVDPTSI